MGCGDLEGWDGVGGRFKTGGIYVYIQLNIVRQLSAPPKKRFLFLPPCWKPKGIFLRYLPWESGQIPGEKYHHVVCVGGGPLSLDPPGVLNPQTFPH